MKTAKHYSHSFELKLSPLPCKASDRISLRILYPGIFFGTALMLLALYEFGSNFSSYGKFDAVFSVSSENPHDFFLNPVVFDAVIFALGLWVVASLFMSYIRYRKILFDGNVVQIIDRRIGGKKITYKEKLQNYEGVQMRIEFFQFGFLNRNRYIIELRHKNLHKVAPLYISTSSKNIRARWKFYAKSLNLPALIQTDSGLVRRNVEDLDKSVKTLYKEGKLQNEYDASEPLPASVVVVRKKDKTVIKMAKILWDAYNLIILGIITIAIIVLGIVCIQGQNISPAAAISCLLLLCGGIVLLLRRDKIAIKKHKFVIVHKFPFCNFKNDEISKGDTEAVVVTENPATGRYFLSLTSNTKNVVFGKKMPAEDLNWVRKYLINDIVTK